MYTGIMVVDEGTLNFQFFLKIGLKLSIDIVNYRLIAEKKKIISTD